MGREGYAVMSAACLRAPRRVELTVAPVPEPGPGQVCVRLEGCGVCASNLGPWHGAPWFTYPFPPGALGHEGWGVVEALGEGVCGGPAVGQRVATLSQAAYAQFDVVDAASVVPLPAALDGRPKDLDDDPPAADSGEQQRPSEAAPTAPAPTSAPAQAVAERPGQVLGGSVPAAAQPRVLGDPAVCRPAVLELGVAAEQERLVQRRTRVRVATPDAHPAEHAERGQRGDVRRPVA